MRPFGDYAERMLDSGFMPVPMRGKRPLIGSWNCRPLGARAIKNLIGSGKGFAEAGLALRTGKLVAVDIDHDDANLAYGVMEKVFASLGKTDYIRVGRFPRRVLFYRADTIIRSGKVGQVEILGNSRLVVVAGMHPLTSQPYYWPEESLLDASVSSVPKVTEMQVENLVAQLHRDLFAEQTVAAERRQLNRERSRLAAEAAIGKSLAQLQRRVLRRGPVVEGERNNTLFIALKDQAHKCRTKEHLLSQARATNACFHPPLPDGEVEAVVDSVWHYKSEGKLLVRGRQKTLLDLQKEDIIRLSAEAIKLLALLEATRTKKTFTIEQKATAKLFGWGSNRVKKAIDDLLEQGHLSKVGTPRPLESAKYRFATPTP
jgi:hypothetical protein